MSFFCSKPNHSLHSLILVCTDKCCPNNEAICHYCLYENHSGHMVIPIEIFLTSFQANLCQKSPNYDLMKLKTRITNFSEIEEKYLQKLNDFQKSFNIIIETLKSKLISIFDADSELFFLQKAHQILDLQRDFEKGLPKTTEGLQRIITTCMDFLSKSEEKNLADSSLFDLKCLNNALDLSLSRLSMFDSKLSKIIQKTLKSLDTDFRFVLSQISIVISKILFINFNDFLHNFSFFS